jgi:predicted nucleic acid-binding protein
VIFVDTSFFVALLDPRDKNHPRAVEAFEEFEGCRLSDQLLTTNNVVLETITVARYEAGHALAVKAGEMLYGEKLARLHRSDLSRGRRQRRWLRLCGRPSKAGACR